MKRWMVAGLVCYIGCSVGNGGSVSVTGQIEGVSVDAGSRVGGRVDEVLVEEGDRVSEGDVLVRLESFEAKVVLDAAQAQLDQAEAVLAKLEAGARPEQVRQAEAALAQVEAQYRMTLEGARSQEVRAAHAAVQAAKAQRDQAEATFTRVKQLHDQGAVSPQVHDEARHALDAAQARYDAAAENLDMVVEGARTEQIMMAKAARDRAQAALDELKAGARAEDIAAARAARDAAEADQRRAQIGADEMVITAPCDGVVESIDIHPGDLVKPGPIVRVTDPEALELTVYVSAAVLGHLRLNQPVVLTTDSHGRERFEGVLAQLATSGEFTPRNLQTQEERVQQVFGIKVKLDSAGGMLKAGMTATAHFDLDSGED